MSKVCFSTSIMVIFGACMAHAQVASTLTPGATIGPASRPDHVLAVESNGGSGVALKVVTSGSGPAGHFLRTNDAGDLLRVDGFIRNLGGGPGGCFPPPCVPLPPGGSAFTAVRILGSGLGYLSGPIGIGTESPKATLDVRGGIQISTAAIPMGLTSEVNGTTPLLNLDVNFRHGNKDTTLPGAAFRIDTRDGSPLFQWLSRLEGSTIETEAMVLTTEGRLGLGTSNPGARLNVSSGGGEAAIYGEASSPALASVFGVNSSKGPGVSGVSSTGPGVAGESPTGEGVRGTSNSGSAGVFVSTGAGDIIRGLDGNDQTVFSVSSAGVASARVLEITGGADLAEYFDVQAGGLDDADKGASIVPGTVVSIDPDGAGSLVVSSEPYDTRVAGVVSGLRGLNPGMILRQSGALDGGHPVAIAGRVYCLADTSAGSIKAGDLLTTSVVPGHVMKVNDSSRAVGSVVGKALTNLEGGTGAVLVLVSLH